MDAMERWGGEGEGAWGADSRRKIRWEKEKLMGCRVRAASGTSGTSCRLLLLLLLFLLCWCHEESGGPLLGPPHPPPSNPEPALLPPHEISRNYFLTQAACSGGALASLGLPLGRSWK